MAIGGYNQFKFIVNNTIHDAACRFQSARAALYAFLKASGARKIYLPNYLCDSILPAINSLKIDIEWYEIGTNLLPIKVIDSIKEGEYFLLVNYFGLLTDKITTLVAKEPKSFIVDNSQALFSPHIANTTSIYSFRKFLAIPDGGALYTSYSITAPEIEFAGEKHLAHLMLRAAGEVQRGYSYFLQAEQALEDYIPQKMSKVSEYLLSCNDLEFIKDKRQSNYQLLHDKFNEINRFNLPLKNNIPLCYPLFLPFNVSKICTDLVQKGIYLPRYWPALVSQDLNTEFFNNTLFLPVDERLDAESMTFLCSNIISAIEQHDG
ncbi:hypothetical protein [Rheinheimera salexigens]|uniref:DegT/DnrJ/EryC1/StrS aminotransferase family protein n=1 Tax=Rheinheimera salexigens TaxID=1628148 RepID=A0A1E7Q567_9GAMM|nr:hypothetical protein [Rheinheimera salexigens]OEY69213.1 hypothetical protein BI198_06230 [Rheinheimera salexigens]